MTTTNEYLLKAAQDEHNFYRLQLQQNWLAVIQNTALVALMPLLFRDLIGRFLTNPGAIFSARPHLIDYFATNAWVSLVAALIFLVLQALPSISPIWSKDPLRVALDIANQEQEKIGFVLADLPDGIRNLVEEIIRLRTKEMIVAETLQIRLKWIKRKAWQAMTTCCIAIAGLCYLIFFILSALGYG